MPLSHAGFFLLRSPLYPTDMYKEVMQGELGTLMTRYPAFRYALYIASRELVHELQRLQEDPTAFNEKKITKLRNAVYKYWVRACTRSTPYGLFAGCTLGKIGDSTDIRLEEATAARQYVRLDTDYYTNICQHIQEIPAIRSHLKYYVNNSVYKIGGKYRYAEYTIRDSKRRYLLNAVESSVFIDRIIAAADGSTADEIAAMIQAEDDSITPEEAMDFINELIASQLLIAATEPRITGDDNLEQLNTILADIPAAAGIRNALSELKEMFTRQDYSTTRLDEIRDRCEAAFPVPLPKDLLQIDMFRTAGSCMLSEGWVNGMLKEMNELLVMASGARFSSQDMKQFISSFTAKYDAQEMPLNIVLDAEAGIGFGTSAAQAVHAPFVEDIANAYDNSPTTVTWTQQQQLALDKYEEALKDNRYTVAIQEADLAKFGDPTAVKMARSCYIFGTLLAASAAAAEQGDYQFRLQSLSGPTSSALLGRFCSGDPLLTAQVKAALETEAAAYPDAVLAEIVHFPEARIANVLIRPVLRTYEIPYIGMSGASAAHQLPVSDLMVSVVNNEVILRSKRLNKRVIPRLSSAHNYSYNSLPVYRFLCELQQSGTGSIYWEWGVLENRARLPRVVYKHIILNRASWTLTQQATAAVSKDPETLLRWLHDWRPQQQVPAQVVIAEADNELFLDLTQLASVAILADKLSKSPIVLLKEFLGEADGGIIRDAAGKTYTSELLLPLHYTPEQPPPPMVLRRAGTDSTVARTFAPGSEWLYVKIYCGPTVAEKLLSVYLAPELPVWQEDGLFEQFFYLRYNDPEPHLRLRFLNAAHPANNDIILRRLLEGLAEYLDSGQVSRLQCDTYERELERYGTATMALSEQLFCSDSMAVIGILEMLEGAAGEHYRWKLAMRGTDMLLDDFGLSLPQKKELLVHLRKAFTSEFGEEKALHKQLNDKYRKFQREILSVMAPEEDETNEITPAIELFTQRSAVVRTVAAEIRNLLYSDAAGSLQLESLIASYLHMFLNRIFVTKQRKHELVVYFFLEKYYLSQTALAGQKK